MVFGGATLVLAGLACGGKLDEVKGDMGTPSPSASSTHDAIDASAEETGPVAVMYGAPPPVPLSSDAGED